MSLEDKFKALEGKSEAALRNMLAAAHQVESDAKKALYVARQRITILPTHAKEVAEKPVAQLEAEVTDSIEHVQAISAKLRGEVPASVASDATPVVAEPVAEEPAPKEEVPVEAPAA